MTGTTTGYGKIPLLFPLQKWHLLGIVQTQKVCSWDLVFWIAGSHLWDLRLLQIFESGYFLCLVRDKHLSVLYKLVIAISELLESNFCKGWRCYLSNFGIFWYWLYFLPFFSFFFKFDSHFHVADRVLPMNSYPAAPTWHSLVVPKVVPKPKVPKSPEEALIF